MKKKLTGMFIVALLLGVPASSHAISDAERLNLQQQIISLKELIVTLKARLAEKHASEVRVWKESAPVTARGTLIVEPVSSVAMKLNVVVYPPRDCTGEEQLEFVLTIGNGETRTYKIEDCKVGKYTENVIYLPSLVPAYPELVMRQVDTANNVWMNYVQARYKIDLSNPLKPGVQNLDVNGSKG